MNNHDLCGIISCISDKMDQNREELTYMDQQNGDGDLGISICAGYHAVLDYLKSTEETDLGRLLNKAADRFNEAAPSSLGTITAFGFKGMAIKLKGKQDASLAETATAMKAGLERIMERAGSKPGEKTILDALVPGVAALERMADKPISCAVSEAARCARAGSESTKQMRAVWGRAAYYGEQSIGILDGGSVVGALIFEGIAAYVQQVAAAN